MADPLSISGAVGTTLQLLHFAWKTVQLMQRVWDNYHDGDKTLRYISIECKIYAESIKTIGQWLGKNRAATQLKRQMITIHSAISLVQVSMGNMNLDLQKFLVHGKTKYIKEEKDTKLSKQKQEMKAFYYNMKNAVNKERFTKTMSAHLAEMRAHAATLHLTLGVIDLAGHTPIYEEKAVEKLEVKTGKLERRILLRQVITKILESKQAQTGELSGRPNVGKSPSTAFPRSVQNTPQKLTFYDIVQLARQQAYAEKTRRSNDDLIDLSDVSQSSLNPSQTPITQAELMLLDFGNPVSPRPSSQPGFGTPEMDSAMEKLNNHPIMAELDAGLHLSPPPISIAELDAAMPLNPPSMDLIQLAELDASQVDGPNKQKPIELVALAKTPMQSRSQGPPCSGALINQDAKSEDQPGLEVMVVEDPSIIGPDSKEVIETCASPATIEPDSRSRPSNAAVNNEEKLPEDIPDDKSVTSSTAPSIFSRFSSRTSTTGSSLPGITEEELQERKNSIANIATTSVLSNSTSLTSKTGGSLPGITEEELQERNSSIGNKVKAPSLASSTAPTSVTNMILGSASPSYQTSPSMDDDAKTITSMSLNPKNSTAQESAYGANPMQSEDCVSLPPSLPHLENIDEPDQQGFPWIVQAARDGNEDLIKKLLISGARIEVCHAVTQRSALAEASLQGHQSIVDILIEEGSPLGDVDVEQNTALHHACQNGHLAIAKSLITKGAPIDASGLDEQSPIHLAMKAPYQNVVMLLIQHKANINARDSSSWTPLHIAASQNNVAMCTYLLNEGAQLDSRDLQSRTPLQLACEAGYYPLVQMMLDHARLVPTNLTFLTAFFASVERGHVRISESFFSQGLKLSELRTDLYKPLTLAAKSGSLDMVQLMIQEGCDANARDEKGWNALHFASYHGHYQVIERLLGIGVSAKATTTRKETPLLFAVKGGHFSVAERLLRSEKGSSLVHAEDERGQQVVHHVVRAGSIDIFNLLMSNGAKIKVENSFGWQPLHIALAYGHLALVERLLQQGANVEEKLGSSSVKKDQTHKIVEEGYTAEARWPYPGSRALHLACEYGHEQIASFLISKGAKRDTSCGEGWQPLHHASYFGSSALVEILLLGGVNPHTATNEGKTALALGYCTEGKPIPDGEKQRIQYLLREAMERTKKEKNLKGALKKASTVKTSTVEDKNKLLRAATFSIIAVSRPQLNKAKTTAQIPGSAATYADLTPMSHRPRLSHLPHTSPLPSKEFTPNMSIRRTSTSSQQLPQAEVNLLALASTTDLDRKSTDTTATEASALVLRSDSFASQGLPSNNNEDADATAIVSTESQLSADSKPRIKRRTTFGLAKVGKPGLDVGKLSLAGMSKPTFELGKQTLDIGKQTIELGNKTLEFSKQGLEISKQGIGKSSRQGLEMGKKGVDEAGRQGREMSKKGVDMGKQGYKSAKKFATKGLGKKGEKGKTGKVEGSQGGERSNEPGVGGIDEDEANDSDDAKSVFSLGEFADVGSKDF